MGEISRRDFLNGVLLAAGGIGMSQFFPLRAMAATSIDQDERALHGGNLSAVFGIAHWLRDGRLSFSADAVVVAKSAADQVHGRFAIEEDDARPDVITVGSGMSGLSAAYHLREKRPGARILVLDAQAQPGGNAGRDDAAPLPSPAGTGASYGLAPTAPFLERFYAGIGVDWQANIVPDPVYSYYFDDRTPFVRAGHRGWSLDTYATGLANVPYPEEVRRDLERARDDFRAWGKIAGAPKDPADASDPKYDHLAMVSFDHYLTKTKALHPAVSDFYTRYTVDALCGTTAQVSAYSAISFLRGEFSPLFAFPGGNSGIVRHVLKALVPSSIAGKSQKDLMDNPINLQGLDSPGGAVRIRQGAFVFRGDTSADGASVVYYKDGKFRRARAKAVIFAGQSHTARTACAHLLGPEQARAFAEVTLAPVVVANVGLRRAAAVADLGYNAYYWGSRYWADFVVADWVQSVRHQPDRATVLTFLGANTAPPEAMPAERFKLLMTPFVDYERSLRDDMGRVLGPRGFEFDRDVVAVHLYRWGHGMIYPKVGWMFSAPLEKNGDFVRADCARRRAKAPLGRLSFGAQDLEGNPSLECAIAAGLRTSDEALHWL